MDLRDFRRWLASVPRAWARVTGRARHCALARRALQRVLPLLAALALSLSLLPSVRAQVPEAPPVHYLEDAGHVLGLAQVMAPGVPWRASPPGRDPNMGYSASSWWFRVAVPATSREAQVLEIAYPVLDEVEVWVLDAREQVIGHHRLGDKQPFEARPLPMRHFVVPLPGSGATESTGPATQVLARMRTTSAVQFPVRVWTIDEFRAHDQFATVMHGLYLGVMLGMLAYNLFLWLSMRERIYLWYVFWVGGIANFQAAINGLSFQHLWPQATQWNDNAIVFFLALAVLAAGQFVVDFLDLRVRRGWMLWNNHVLSVASGATMVAALYLPYSASIRLVIGLAVWGIVFALIIASLRWREGFQPARIFLMAWSVVLVGGAVLAGNKYGLLPRNLLTESATQIGSALEVVMLSLALAGRLNGERRLREIAQAEVIRTQQAANAQLEARVAERTQALEALNRRLDDASRTDVLTGVFNRRHFDECLSAEVKRALRSGQPLGVLLIDLDHFKRVNDTHGHAAGDACLRAAAERAAGVLMRSTDVLARYGGEEFIALLPMTDRAGCLAVAELLRAAIARTPVVHEGQLITVTASIGVTCRPLAGPDDGPALVHEADLALYDAKRQGRNRVCAAPWFDLLLVAGAVPPAGAREVAEAVDVGQAAAPARKAPAAKA